MSGRKARGGPRPLRRLALCVESLDARLLLSRGIGPPAGTFLAPATVRPRVPGPAPKVVPNLAVNRVLGDLLGPSLQTVLQQASSHNVSAGGELIQQIFDQP